MMSGWSHREEYHKRIKKTDEQYGDQYDILFPNDPWGKVADIMDAPPETDLSQEFILRIEDYYRELWAENNTLPTLSEIEEKMYEWIDEKITELTIEEFADDIEFQENEDYRNDMIEDYNIMYWETEGWQLNNQIIEALEYLGYACYNDHENEMVSPAQRELFPMPSDKK